MKKHTEKIIGAQATSTQKGRGLLDRRRFVKSVSAGSVLAFGIGIPSPITVNAGFGSSVIYYLNACGWFYGPGNKLNQ